jgi:putative permease
MIITARRAKALNKLNYRPFRQKYLMQLAAVSSLLLLGLLILFFVDNMLVSFFLAFVITFLLSPLVNLLERKGISRTLAISIPFALVGVLLGILIASLAPAMGQQWNALVDEFPKYVTGVKDLIANTEGHANKYLSPLYSINISTSVANTLKDWANISIKGLPDIGTVLVLAPFFAFFLLRDGRQIFRQILTLIPNNLFELSLGLSYRLNDQVGGFIRARLLEAAIVGIVVWFGLILISFPYALFLALFAALCNLIPYVGPFIGAVPTLAIALINKDPSLTILFIVSIYFIAQLIDILFIIPGVVAKLVNLHPVTVIVVIIIGAQIMGILGMIISIPVASALKLTVQTIYHHLVGYRQEL